MLVERLIIYLFLFFCGGVIGAFLNWYVDRYGWIQRFRSPWRRHVRFKKVWCDFLPVFGWFFIRRFGDGAGKLSAGELVPGVGNKWFWVRPFLVELLFAVGVVGLYCWEVELQNIFPEPELQARNPESSAITILRFVSHVILFAFLLAASLTDLDDFIIPENLIVFGTLVGISLAVICPRILLPVTELRIVNYQRSSNFVLTDYHVPLHFCSPDETTMLNNFRLQFEKDSSGKIANTTDSNNTSTYIKKSNKEFNQQFFVLVFLWFFWCFAMLDRVWYFRLSFPRACKIFFRKLIRSPTTKFWIFLSLFFPFVLYFVMLFTSFVGSENHLGLLTSLIGLVFGMWLIWLVRLLAGVALGVEAMGFGDVILLGMIGAFVGWQSCVVIFFCAPLCGILPSLIVLLTGRGRMIPYGPFICLAALILVVFWSPIWRSLEPVLCQSSLQVAIGSQILILLAGAMLVGWRKIKKYF
ncbi:MAG: A24 family peptidase [Planctomycetaceae bacterium]|jgi:prepilin signal peptidase PulO-like enzyme (type II secretory pathway)|nr:A24 family peptidase [Planctomycetaceae bacterium]